MSGLILNTYALGSIVSNYSETELHIFEGLLELRFWGYTSSDIITNKGLREMLPDGVDDIDDTIESNLEMIDDSLTEGIRERVVGEILGPYEGGMVDYAVSVKPIAHDSVLIHFINYD